ncbi:MAG: glycoside hydrolase family 20 zincin-like fold domain-containing protein [Terrimicrobiaceae bacterium]
MTSLSDAILVPRPMTVQAGQGVFFAESGTRVWPVAAGSEAVAKTLAMDLREACVAGHPGTPECRIELLSEPSAGESPESYTLTVERDLITIKAAGARGHFMGRATLRQLLIQGEGGIPCGRITDAPAFVHRGYMLDVSRGKVPTMEVLLALIELLSQLKYNHFQLYLEHTFAYPNHRTVWKNASPFTAEEIREIDVFCRERFIGFVPNQNSLGHMEQWLRHPEYAGLAECPEGFQDPWTPDWRTPSTLSPVLPESLELVSGLYAALLPNFSSGLFNVGCDEPFELGLGLSSGECGKRGKGRVYLDWLLKLRRLCREHGRRMLFWADIINEHPGLVAELPRDMIPLEWGYEKGHPWDEHCARFAAAGLEFFVCPGTSTWCLSSARMRCADADLVREEILLTIDFLKHACRRGLALKSGREREFREELAAELSPLIPRYRELWGRRNRPGGLDDSTRLLDDLLRSYTSSLK